MKKILILFLLITGYYISFSRNVLKLNGTIGTYSIEMQLNQNNNPQDTILGKYNYKGKTAFLTLEAVLYEGRSLYIKESYNGELTGEFYLEHEEGNWSGKWIAGSKSYDVDLTAMGGDLTSFHSFKSDVPEKNVNSNITGTYNSEYYFINDMWFTKENPTINVGYNGGTVLVDEIDGDSIRIAFETVSGPTFHIASFTGVVPKVGSNKYVFNAPLYEDDNNCHLVFEFKDKQLEILQNSTNMDCGFGARAYAGGTFEKLNNSVLEDEYLQLGK